MSARRHTWLEFSSGKPPSFRIEAWHPFDFDWDLLSLHKRLKELKRLKLVLETRPKAQTGSHPEVLFDQLPLPLLTSDNYVSEIFDPYLKGFVMMPVKTGFVSGGRYMKLVTSLLPVPTTQVMYDDATLIPKNRHIAIINGRFCITKALVSKEDFYFRCIEFKPFRKTSSRLRPKSKDCTNLFIPRPKAAPASVQRKFDDWLDNALSQPISSSVVAFSFNLAEPWCIEVVGSNRYSPNDSDWACEESFHPDVEPFELSEFEHEESWKVVLAGAKRKVAAYLARRSDGRAILRKAKAVAVGFIDGDLHKVWPK